MGKLVRFGQKAYNDRGGDTDAGVAIYEAATIGRITRDSREERERAAAEEREKLLREAIDEEKRKLYEAENHENENADTNSEEAGD